jgi:dipeptidyl-peptidase-4
MVNHARRRRFAAAFALAFLFLPTAAIRAQIPTGGKRLLTLDDVYGPIQPIASWGSLPYVTGWLADGQHYLEFADNGAGEVQLMRVDARTGMSAPLYDAPRMEAALAAQPGMDMAAAHRLAYRETITLDPRGETRALIAHGSDLFLYDLKAGRAARLTAPDAKGEATDASFSPDGKRVAFVRGNDLYVADVAAPGRERRLTRDGSPKILNGRLDWVYEEEVYGRGKSDGYAWSPDGTRIAFLRLDDTPVRPHALLNSVPRKQEVEEQSYPKPGDPNPVATLGIVPADGSAPARSVDVSAYPAQDRLIVRFAWTPDNASLSLQVQDRAQTFLDLLTADPATGRTTRLLRETTGRWVEPAENPVWLKDGTFLWLSDRSGWRHLYRFNRDGTSPRPLTKGEWEIRTLYGVDPAVSHVYFSASEHSPIAAHVYRLPLTGADAAAPPPQRLTADHAGSHTNIRFDPTFTRFLDMWSGIATPPRLRIADAATGADVRLLGDSRETVRQIAPYQVSRPEFVQVKARDGFPLEAVLIRPPDFNPAKKYPVFCPVYGGPGSPSVKDEWSGRDFLFWQFLAQKGYIVWLCDNRSASGKGAQSQWPIYKNLGASELADIEDGLAYLKKQTWTDPARVGIYGWSYGGFLAEYALTHSKSFKVGIAAAGVSDWRLYDTIYTERYLDTPERNREGYRASSAIAAADNTSGKLLLVHGMMDDNVHLQNTIQMTYALQKAGKRFEMMLYPGPEARHGFSDAQLDRHVNIYIVEFILRNL